VNKPATLLLSDKIVLEMVMIIYTSNSPMGLRVSALGRKQTLNKSITKFIFESPLTAKSGHSIVMKYRFDKYKNYFHFLKVSDIGIISQIFNLMIIL